MKKIFYFLFVLSVLFVSCSKDDDKTSDVELIRISEKPASLRPGETFQMKATYEPSDASVPSFKWKSSDVTKATISEKGLLTAISDGTVEITVSALIKQNGIEKELTDKATVSIAAINIEGIQLNHTSIELENGQTATLTASLLPVNAKPREIVWTSSNNDVASVIDGVVKALKVGETTITATVKDTKIKSTCIVTVKDAHLSGIHFKESLVQLIMGETKETEIVFIPEQALSGLITYNSLDLSVASVDENGKISAISEGKTKIEAVSDKGFKAVCDVEVVHYVKRIFVSKTGSLIEVGGSVTGDATFTINNKCGKDIEVRKFIIVDRNGKVTYNQDINQNLANNGSFDVSYKFNNMFVPSFAFIVQIDQMEYKLVVE